MNHSLTITTHIVHVDANNNPSRDTCVMRFQSPEGVAYFDIYPEDFDVFTRAVHSATIRAHTENQRLAPPEFYGGRP